MLCKELSLLFLIKTPQAESDSGAWSCRKLVMHPVVTSPSRWRHCGHRVLCCLPGTGLSPEEVFWGATQELPAWPRKRSSMEWRTHSHPEGNDRAPPECGTYLALQSLKRFRWQRICDLGSGKVVVRRQVLWNHVFNVVKTVFTRSGVNEAPLVETQWLPCRRMLWFCPLQKISICRLYSFVHAGCFFWSTLSPVTS